MSTESNNSIFNLPSANISIFPISFDRTEGATDVPEGHQVPKKSYKNGRIISEENISSLIRQLSDRDCYVVKCDGLGNSAASNVTFHVIMNGRYFKFTINKSDKYSDESDPLLSSDLWIGIKLTNNDSTEFEQLVGYDYSNSSATTDNLYGIDFMNSEPDSTYSYALKLLEKLADKNVRVPIESQFRFTSDKAIKHISGGIV